MASYEENGSAPWGRRKAKKLFGSEGQGREIIIRQSVSSRLVRVYNSVAIKIVIGSRHNSVAAVRHQQYSAMRCIRCSAGWRLERIDELLGKFKVYRCSYRSAGGWSIKISAT